MLLNDINPSLTRTRTVVLDGEWSFQPDRDGIGERDGWHRGGRIVERRIPVPACWEAVFPDLRGYYGACWYETVFTLPSSFDGRRLHLQFGAADYAAKVWINGILIGEHEGGHTPFVFDIGESARAGRGNTIVVKVTEIEDLTDLPGGGWERQPTIGPLNMGGIWQSVQIEAVGDPWLSDIFVQPDVGRSTVRIRTFVRRADLRGDRRAVLSYLVEAPDRGQTRGELPIELPDAGSEQASAYDVELPLRDPILWELDDPRLHTLTVSVRTGSTEASDSAAVSFGMRTIETRGTKILLNGRPVYLSGVLDYSYNPDLNVFLPTYHRQTDEELAAALRLAKGMGLNFIRKHGSMPDPRYLDAADRVGMLVIITPPTNWYSDRFMTRFRSVLRTMVVRDRNHPSVAFWEFFNETDGLPQKHPDFSYRESLELIQDMYDEIKQLDPTRPIIDTSGGFVVGGAANYLWNHGATDVDDLHQYIDSPEFYDTWKDWVDGIQAREKPVIVSETMAPWGQPDITRITEAFGGIPWWLAGTPIEEHYREWGFDRVFASLDDFTDRVNWHTYECLKDEIEKLRLNPDICGYVICSLFDRPYFAHGLMTYFGEKKVHYDALANLQRPDLLVLDWRKRNLWVGEKFTAPVWLSHYGKEPLRDGIVRWELDGCDIGGEFPAVAAEPGSVTAVGLIEFLAPDVPRSESRRIQVRLHQGTRLICENDLEILVYPREHVRATLEDPINLYVPYQSDFLLRRRLQIAGYRCSSQSKEISDKSGIFIETDVLNHDIPVAVATVFDEKVDEYLRQGGSVLLLLRDGGKIHSRVAESFPVTVGEHNGVLSFGPFYYANPVPGLFDRIPYANPMTWPFYRVFPRTMIVGLKPSDRENIIVGGFGTFLTFNYYLGGLTSPTGKPLGAPRETKGDILAGIYQCRYGEGTLVICTFRLADLYLDDPAATIMMNDLIGYLANLPRSVP